MQPDVRLLCIVVIALTLLPLCACWESKQQILANCKMRAIEAVEFKPEYAIVDPSVIPAVISYVSSCMIAAGYSKTKRLTALCSEQYAFSFVNIDDCWDR